MSLKNHFQYITAEKFQAIIKELINYDIIPNSENDHLPDHNLLASKLSLDLYKTNKLLKDLFNLIISDLSQHPLLIKNLIHTL